MRRGSGSRGNDRGSPVGHGTLNMELNTSLLVDGDHDWTNAVDSSMTTPMNGTGKMGFDIDMGVGNVGEGNTTEKKEGRGSRIVTNKNSPKNIIENESLIESHMNMMQKQ